MAATAEHAAGGEEETTPPVGILEDGADAPDDEAFMKLISEAQADRLAAQITTLNEERVKMRKLQKLSTKKLRNAQKVRSRLKKKSEGLSSKELIDVLALRWQKDKAKMLGNPSSASGGTPTTSE